eukprot:Lankesteria_metandrocarpae@DN5454_c2_g1_i12.p2
MHENTENPEIPETMQIPIMDNSKLETIDFWRETNGNLVIQCFEGPKGGTRVIWGNSWTRTLFLTAAIVKIGGDQHFAARHPPVVTSSHCKQGLLVRQGRKYNAQLCPRCHAIPNASQM